MTASPELSNPAADEKFPTKIDLALAEAALVIGTKLPPVVEWGPAHNREDAPKQDDTFPDGLSYSA